MKAKFLLFVDTANLCPGNIFAAVLAVGFVAGVPPFLAEAKRFIILTGDFSVLSHFYASSPALKLYTGRRIFSMDTASAAAERISSRDQIGRASCRERVYVLV